MRVRHPYSLDDDAPDPDATVHWGGRRDWSDVDSDGTFTVPDDRAEQFVESWPEADGYSLDDLRVDEDGESGDSGEASDDAGKESEGDHDAGTCTATLTNGEVCGRELPCQYHTED